MYQIARSIRQPIQNILVFVEGDTEENYFKSLRKHRNNNIKLSFKTSNMDGGGYNNFLNKIRKESTKGYIAFFIIIDLDKVQSDSVNFNKLLDYCKKKNSEKNQIPYFLIGTNKDFEFFACCHCPKYKVSKDTKSYIEKEFNFRDLNKFKSDSKIYEFLNGDGRTVENALETLKKIKPYIENIYKKTNKGLDISINITQTNIDPSRINSKNSNINEFFDLIL